MGFAECRPFLNADSCQTIRLYENGNSSCEYEGSTAVFENLLINYWSADVLGIAPRLAN